MTVDEGLAVGEERPHLRFRKRGEDRPTARRELHGEPHIDVGHERRGAGCALLHHVEHVASMGHREVAAQAHSIDERGEQGPPDPRERLLARVGRAQVDCGDTETETALLRQVHHEPVLLQRVQQMVDRGTRQIELARDHARRERPAGAREQAEDPQRLIRGRNLRGAHAPQPIRSASAATQSSGAPSAPVSAECTAPLTISS